MSGHEHDETCLLDCNRCHKPVGDAPWCIDATGHMIHLACAPRPAVVNPLDPDEVIEEVLDQDGEVIGIVSHGERRDSTEIAAFPDAAGVLDRVEEKPAVPEIPLTAEDRKVVLDSVSDAVFQATRVEVKLPNPFEGLELPAEDLVNHPKHYTSHPSGVECIDLTRHMAFAPGNAFKYIFRFDHKNGRQDLEKAVWYLNDTLNNPVPILLPSWGLEQYRLLDLVCDHTPAPMRMSAYRWIVGGRPLHALEAVHKMLDAD